MARVRSEIVAGVAVFCFVAMGAVGSAGQAKPATAKPAVPARNVAAAKALKNPVAADTASIDAGKTVYAKYCRACHGTEGKGNGPGAAALKDIKPADLTDAKWAHGSTDGEIFTNIRDGIPPKFDMNAFGGRIQDKDIWNAVNYVRTLGPAKK